MSERTGTVYTGPGEVLVIDAVKVPGGMLYVVSHHIWHTMNTVFVPDIKESDIADNPYGPPKNFVNPQFVQDFIEGKR